MCYAGFIPSPLFFFVFCLFWIVSPCFFSPYSVAKFVIYLTTETKGLLWSGCIGHRVMLQIRFHIAVRAGFRDKHFPFFLGLSSDINAIKREYLIKDFTELLDLTMHDSKQKTMHNLVNNFQTIMLTAWCSTFYSSNDLNIACIIPAKMATNPKHGWPLLSPPPIVSCFIW